MTPQSPQVTHTGPSYYVIGETKDIEYRLTLSKGNLRVIKNGTLKGYKRIEDADKINKLQKKDWHETELKNENDDVAYIIQYCVVKTQNGYKKRYRIAGKDTKRFFKVPDEAWMYYS